jgi:hypothetical protein
VFRDLDSLGIKPQNEQHRKDPLKKEDHENGGGGCKRGKTEEHEQQKWIEEAMGKERTSFSKYPKAPMRSEQAQSTAKTMRPSTQPGREEPPPAI